MEWVMKGVKLMRRWLRPDDGVDVILNKVAVQQLINGLPNEVKVWVALRNPETPAAVAELIETYDSAHCRSKPSREKPRYQDQKHSSKAASLSVEKPDFLLFLLSFSFFLSSFFIKTS